MRTSSWNRSTPCGAHERFASTITSPLEVSNFTRKTSGTTTFSERRQAEAVSPNSTTIAAACMMPALLRNSQQLDFEDQRRAAGDVRRSSPVAIGDVRRADQLCFPAHLHLLNALGPRRNHPVQRKLRRLIPGVGAVKLLAVDQRSAVV